MASHEKQGNPITFQKVDMAVCNLYGSWECIPEHSQKYIRDIMQEGNYNSKYDLIIKEEQQAKNILINFEQEYPQVLNTKNMEKILLDLKAKQSKRDSILEQLKSKKM